MALGNFTNIKKTKLGSRFLITGTYVPVNPQSATGDAITSAALKQLKLNRIDVMIFQPANGNAGTTMAPFSWERATGVNGTIHIYNQVDAHTHPAADTGNDTVSSEAAAANYAAFRGEFIAIGI